VAEILCGHGNKTVLKKLKTRLTGYLIALLFSLPNWLTTLQGQNPMSFATNISL